MEPPTVFSYIGVAPESLRANISPLLETAPLHQSFDWQLFREGLFPVHVQGGAVLGAISERNEAGGFRAVTFTARTFPVGEIDPRREPANFLDPVALYDLLAQSTLANGQAALATADTSNSWLTVATKDRVIITFRDEWNQPLVAASETATISGGGASIEAALTSDRAGTVVVPGSWGTYTCSIAGRKLTPIPSNLSSTDNATFSVSAPGHQIVGTVRREDWFHPTDPALSDPAKVLQPLYTEGNKVKPLVDGDEAFPALVDDLKQISSADHWALFGSWRMIHDFELVPGDKESTLKKLLTKVNAAGAKTRALIWDQAAAIEDQYLVYADLRDELLNVLPRIDYLVVVIDGTCDMGTPPKPSADCARARYLFLDPIHKAYPDKLHVFTLGNHGSAYKVHSKVVIINDIMATIGSANMARRSMTHDSELNVFVLDGRIEDGVRKFARDLRVKLWAEHLGWHRNPKATSRLANIDQAVKHLTKDRPATARLIPYDLTSGKGTSYPVGWDTTVDPDGTEPP